MKKRILPALLALCMVMALLPATVFAYETTDTCVCNSTDHSGTNNACSNTIGNDGDTTKGLCASCAGHTQRTQCTDSDCQNLDKFHEGNHTYNCTCADEASCAGDHSGHTATYTAATKGAGLCDSCTAAAPTPEEPEQKTYTETVEAVELTCTCGLNHSEAGVHDRETEGETACTNTKTQNVTVSFEYDVELADSATEEEKTAWQEGYNSAKNSAVNAYKAAWLCDACTKDETKACTGTVDCTSQAHKDDCLSQCTMDGTCENTTGNPAAHKETYTATVTVVDNGTAGAPADIAGGPFYSYESIRTAIDAKVDELQESEEDGHTYKYTTIVTVHHCLKAGVSDSVILGGDDETTDPTDPTDPEVKAPEKAEDFSDLKGDEWYAEELTALMEKGVFKGSLDDGKYSFNATGNVTGAELVVLLSRVAGEDLVTTGTEWNKAATEWAAEAGYTEGVDITTTGKMTRQDVILVLWRAAGKPASEQSLEDFADAEGLEGDYLSAMKWAVEKGIIKGDGDTGALKADANITRAEMVSVLTRYSNAK